jgi:uncharacterized protein YutE (UPF0331/DUF86 family)
VTDEGLVSKKLALIETYVAELRRLARPELVETDLLQRRFVEHTLQIAIQACQDVASHIVSDDRLGEPKTNQELFALLSTAGWISAGTADAMRRAVGFRNIVVHGYAAVDGRVVREILERNVGDLLAFVAEIRAKLPASDEP